MSCFRGPFGANSTFLFSISFETVTKSNACAPIVIVCVCNILLNITNKYLFGVLTYQENLFHKESKNEIENYKKKRIHTLPIHYSEHFLGIHNKKNYAQKSH